jgi:hypothetical protein
MPGKARDLAINSNKNLSKTTIYALGLSKVGGGYEILKYHFSTGSWHSRTLSAINIAVAPNGDLWYVTADYRVFRKS